MKFTKSTARVEGEIVFAKRTPFQNGGGVNTYIVKVTESYTQDNEEKTYSQSIVCKDFESDTMLYDKGDVVIVDGYLKCNRYKDEDDNWIDKGVEVVAESIIKVDDLPY
jgi:single-stranded DNA-binding protein